MREISPAEVVIVGGGLEGLSIAYALTERGVRDVLVLERHTVGSGGTGKSSGIVRCHYGVSSLAAMAWAGLQLFEQAADVLGTQIGFRQCGYVVGVGTNNVAALRANLAMHQGLGIEVELIGHDAVAAMWPGIELGDFAAFAHEPRGGYGDAYLTCQAFAGAARRGGARVLQQSPVVEIVTCAGRVEGVRLADGTMVGAGTVVVAAGPWSVALLAPLGVDLPIRAMREPVVLVDPGAACENVPVLSDLVSLQYVRAETGGRLLVGNSDLSEPEWADPDHYIDRADQPELDRTVRRFAGRFPGLPEASLATSYAGCYDVTPDFNPVIGPAGPDGLLVAAGFSGHGYKISPAVGTLVAGLITGEPAAPGVDPADFDLARFAAGTPTTSPNPYVGAGEMR